MTAAFFESIKYVGHMLPLAFLRIFLGYFYVNRAMIHLRGDFLSFAYLNEEIRSHLPTSSAPVWYQSFLESIVLPNWQLFAFLLTISYLAIGMSYIMGYLVRPLSLVGLIICLNLILAVGQQDIGLQPVFLAVMHITLGWAGAGRCLGVDYYFYKRRRGLWW